MCIQKGKNTKVIQVYFIDTDTGIFFISPNHKKFEMLVKPHFKGKELTKLTPKLGGFLNILAQATTIRSHQTPEGLGYSLIFCSLSNSGKLTEFYLPYI